MPSWSASEAHDELAARSRASGAVLERGAGVSGKAPLVQQFERWVSERETEGLTLEFKSGKLLESENLKRSGRHQLTKAVASLANAEGGLVAIGIAEAADEPGWSAADHIEVAPPAWYRDRVLLFLNDNISPPISKLDVEVEKHDGGSLILVRVPASFVGHQNRREDGKGGEYRTRRANGVSEPLDGRDVRQLLTRLQLPDPVAEIRFLRTAFQLLLTTRTGLIDRYRVTLLHEGWGSTSVLPGFKTAAALPTFGREGQRTFREAADALIFPGVHEQLTYLNVRFDASPDFVHLAAMVQVPGVPARLFAWRMRQLIGVPEPVCALQSAAWWRGIDVRDPMGNAIENETPQERLPDE